MGRNDIEGNCQKIIPELFSFVSAFVDDVKLAGTLLWQSLEGGLMAGAETLMGRGGVGEMKIVFFRQLYLLLERDQEGPLSGGGLRGFSGLVLPEGVALYLRHQTAFSLEEIGDIMGQDRPSLFSLLHSGRDKMGLSPCPTPSQGECLYGRQVSALIDGDTDKGHHQFLKRHLTHCPSCRDFYKMCADSEKAIRASIPRNPIPRYLQRQWEESLSPLLRDIFPQKESPSPSGAEILRDFFRALGNKWFLGALLLTGLFLLVVLP